MRYFAFRWQPDPKSPVTYLVIAAVSAILEQTEIVGVLDNDHAMHLSPDGILFVLPAVPEKALVSTLRKFVADGTLLRIDLERVSVFAATFDKFGQCGAFEHLGGPTCATWPSDAFEAIKKRGLEEIFLKRKVLMLAGPGMHFQHPRGVHSRGFLRGANAFVNGAEIGFVAMALLQHLPQKAPKQIWIDTSSIAAVAYALIALRTQFDKRFVAPHIESFGSYEGLKTIVLTHAQRSLFLISATASGGMAKLIIKREMVDKERIVTLFSSVQRAKHLTVLFEVFGHPSLNGADGLSLLRIEPAKTCPWCNDNSRVVRFVSDQFLADTIQYTEAKIAERDAPPGLRETAGKFIQRGVFVLTRRAETEMHRFWIDLNGEGVEERANDIQAAVRRFVPVAVTHVIHLADLESQELAKTVATEIEGQTGRAPTLVASTNVATIERGAANAAVVVASCIGSGNGLQNVSRDLREILLERPKSYVVRFAKHAEHERLDALRSNLEHNKSYPHEFACLHKMTLPPLDLNAWTKEVNLLRSLVEGDPEQAARQFIKQRIAALGRERIGCDQELFLRTPRDDILKLHPGFAFWTPGYDSEKVSHGDVLATVASILQHLRTNTPRAARGPKLVSNPFHTSVISPSTFGRYNDGVIQAAFLRAAHAHELNYAGHPGLSSAMLRVVQRTLERWDASQGEAAPEFLMALATRRMALSESDTAKLVATGSYGPNVVLRLLIDAIKAGTRDRT